ncbi:hypothetical protein JB92DRAFT_3140018 [Gautieria morchelliformis]|nr:hypothetical protein JB92DRAFT_3140018 [Gautieria morchelliformis]
MPRTNITKAKPSSRVRPYRRNNQTNYLLKHNRLGTFVPLKKPEYSDEDPFVSSDDDMAPVSPDQSTDTLILQRHPSAAIKAVFAMLKDEIEIPIDVIMHRWILYCPYPTCRHLHFVPVLLPLACLGDPDYGTPSKNQQTHFGRLRLQRSADIAPDIACRRIQITLIGHNSRMHAGLNAPTNTQVVQGIWKPIIAGQRQGCFIRQRYVLVCIWVPHILLMRVAATSRLSHVPHGPSGLRTHIDNLPALVLGCGRGRGLVGSASGGAGLASSHSVLSADVRRSQTFTVQGSAQAGANGSPAGTGIEAR